MVKEVKADGKTVVIDHEEIPNYMAKMVMPFKVKDTNQLAGLGTNDQIHFRFNVAEYESWIDQVMAELPEEAARFAAGERKLQGVLIGAVMKKSGGRADPKKLAQMLGRRVGG